MSDIGLCHRIRNDVMATARVRQGTVCLTVLLITNFFEEERNISSHKSSSITLKKLRLFFFVRDRGDFRRMNFPSKYIA